MDLLILCGGMATRLGATTALTPKVLVEVNGRPFLDYLLALYEPHFDRITLLAGHHGTQLLPYASPGLRVVIEPERLDTGGAILNILDEISDRFSVVNGDTYFEHLDIPAIVGTAATEKALIVVTPGDCACGGCVELDGMRVRSFQEKSRHGQGYLYGGFGVLTRSLLRDFPRQPVSLERVILPDLAHRGSLIAYPAELQMFDIGTPQRLDRFRKHISAKGQT